MEMEYGLAGAAARVDNSAVAATFRQTVIVGDPRRNSQQVAQQRFIFLRRIIERVHVVARNYEYVSWGLRVDITNHDAAAVLINHVGRGSPRQNSAKKAILFAHV